jgi:hypothetical protein
MKCTVIPSLHSQSEFLATNERDWSRVPAEVLARFNTAEARHLDTATRPVGLPADVDLEAAFDVDGFLVFQTRVRFEELA